jgi:hypothetical protein
MRSGVRYRTLNFSSCCAIHPSLPGQGRTFPNNPDKHQRSTRSGSPNREAIVTDDTGRFTRKRFAPILGTQLIVELDRNASTEDNTNAPSRMRDGAPVLMPLFFPACGLFQPIRPAPLPKLVLSRQKFALDQLLRTIKSLGQIPFTLPLKLR